MSGPQHDGRAILESEGTTCTNAEEPIVTSGTLVLLLPKSKKLGPVNFRLDLQDQAAKSEEACVCFLRGFWEYPL
jgi:hypothetical protein